MRTVRRPACEQGPPCAAASIQVPLAAEDAGPQLGQVTSGERGTRVRLWILCLARGWQGLATWQAARPGGVIHFSTAGFVHSFVPADQRVYSDYPQAYPQDATVAGPRVGVIGASSHASPGTAREY